MTDEALELKEINIQQFKLNSGDEIIGLVQGTEKGMVLMEFPLLLNVISVSPNRETYYFTEWMPMVTSEEFIKIHTHSIVAYGECSDSFKEHYIRTALRLRKEPPLEFDADEEEFEDDVFDGIMNARKTIH